jgi:hypothetical protein
MGCGGARHRAQALKSGYSKEGSHVFVSHVVCGVSIGVGVAIGGSKEGSHVRDGVDVANAALDSGHRFLSRGPAVLEQFEKKRLEGVGKAITPDPHFERPGLRPRGR